ncbi:carboxypeptidase-like regulatory domain-containing protein [Winogradskyella poriferorum]|uniref:Carboxypeptidase-like regulatory domain-containing protein n=1 Tax=Winogradskyella poriferorum TaxID=307627 RepID=A0ABU7W7F8_9FLAO
MKRIKNFPNLILILLLSLTVVTSCLSDDESIGGGDPQENIPDTFSEYFGNEISRDFLGTVIDKNHNPIEGVTITIGSETATTDSNGVFMINGATVKQRFGYIKAEKDGYIHASRSVVPSIGTNKVTIMMLEATVVGSVTSGTSGTVTATNGSSVSFDGNFIKEDGSTYDGSVDVILHHLDPADDDMPMQMPGMLYAENENGAERMLQTLGMLAVELRGSGGEDLNLAEGSTSEIKVPVDASLISIAPATIPLWYFDEANGYWKEEGQATLQGNMYVGTVSHFSFWNCDIPTEAITLCVTATNEDNVPLANMYVSITSATFGTTYGHTNENGEVCGYVPSNESLELNVYSYDLCGDNPLHTETVGPFTVDSNITVIVPDNPDIIEETVVGTFNTCDGNAVTDGYVKLSYGYQTFIDTVTNGEFEINLLRCSDNNTFTIEASDYVNLQVTDSISYTFATPITNIGTISACNAITEFIEYTIDDGESTFIFENISANFYTDSPNYPDPTLDIFASSNDQGNCYYMYGALNDPDYLGTYDNYIFDPGTNDTGFFIGECINVAQESNNIIYNLTALGEVGEYIDINFSGSYEDWNGNAHNINGVVHVLRDN